MFKLIKRIICISILTVIAFFVISYLYGGEKFRWFGKKSEEAARIIRQSSDNLADRADSLKNAKDTFKEVINNAMKLIKIVTEMDEKSELNDKNKLEKQDGSHNKSK